MVHPLVRAVGTVAVTRMAVTVMGHVHMAHGRTAVPVIITAVMPGIICPMDSVWRVAEMDIIAPATTPAKASPPDIIPPGGMPTPAPASPGVPVRLIVPAASNIHVRRQTMTKFIPITGRTFCAHPRAQRRRPSVIWTTALPTHGHLNTNITVFGAVMENVTIPHQRIFTITVNTQNVLQNAMRDILSTIRFRWRRIFQTHAPRAVREHIPPRLGISAVMLPTGHTHMPPAVPRAVPARTRMRRRPRLARIAPTGTRIIKQPASLK